MNIVQKIKKNYDARLVNVASRADIPMNTPLVYILLWGDQALVVGTGKYGRARVITDDLKSITPNHKKAIKVRLYRLYGSKTTTFSAFVIRCDSKEESQAIEKDLHGEIGGNDSAIDPKILEKLFSGLEEHSLARLLLRQALCSAFDGISDLKRWRRKKLIEDDVWEEVCERLELDPTTDCSVRGNPLR